VTLVSLPGLPAIWINLLKIIKFIYLQRHRGVLRDGMTIALPLYTKAINGFQKPISGMEGENDS
jgi:hypothetical protein